MAHVARSGGWLTGRHSLVASVLAGGALAAAGRALAEWSAFVEWHRRILLPLTMRGLQPLFGAPTGTMGELAAMSLIVALAFVILRRPRAGLAALALAAGVVVFAFYALWGVSYRYPLLSSRLAPLSDPEARPDAPAIRELARQAVRLVARTAALAPSVDGRSDGDALALVNAGLERGFEALPATLEASPVHAQSFGPAKLSRVSFALSRLQLSGYYFPWTGEAQINGEMPRSLWPRVAAHERAHQRGFARENEATIVGILACLSSDDPFVRYGGSLGLYASFDRELNRLDPVARRDVFAQLPERAVSDYRAEAAFWRRFEGPGARVSEKVNDAYLKTQGVRTGIQSYGETTRLLLQALATPEAGLRRALDAPGTEARP